MKKIINSEDSFVSREHLGEDNKLGILFPNATGGHFLYTFYGKNPYMTVDTSKIDRYAQHTNRRETILIHIVGL